MKLKEFYNKPLKQVIDEMNLIDVKIYSEADGEVQALLLRYTVSYEVQTPEALSGETVPTQKEALDAYNTLKKYCNGQENCRNCLLVTENEMSCIISDAPSGWQHLEI